MAIKNARSFQRVAVAAAKACDRSSYAIDRQAGEGDGEEEEEEEVSSEIYGPFPRV